MPEDFVNVTEGAGKKLHTWKRTVGANDVQDEIVIAGIPYLAKYTVGRSVAITVATADAHLIQVMAGATLNVYITRIRLYQAAVATTAAIAGMGVYRLTTAGTGGTALTPQPQDNTADGASGASAMQLPTVKGAEGALQWFGTVGWIQTIPTSGPEPLRLDLPWGPDTKYLRIPAGVTNGIALKHTSGAAGATAYTVVDFFEANF